MRIGFFYARMEVMGGVENYLLWTAQGLQKRGHYVRILTEQCAPATAERFRQSGIEIADSPRVSDLDVVKVHNWPATVRFLPHRDAVPSLLHLHEPPRHIYEAEMDAHFLCSPLNRQRKPWTVWWDRMMLSSKRKADQAAVAGYRSVLCDSRYIAGKIAQVYGRHDAQPLPFAVPPATLQAAGPPLRPPGYVLGIARLTVMKNIETAIRAIGEMRSPPRLLIVGDGDERPRLEALAQGRPVEFLGWVSDADKARLLRDALCVIHLPLDEPFGLVALEAHMAGKPVVGSDHGGVLEIVEDRMTGYLVPPTAVASVVLALEKLMQAPAEAAAMGSRGQERVSRIYTESEYFTRLEALLKQESSRSVAS